MANGVKKRELGVFGILLGNRQIDYSHVDTPDEPSPNISTPNTGLQKPPEPVWPEPTGPVELDPPFALSHLRRHFGGGGN